MMHGRKREPKKKLSEAEEAAIQAKLDKINKINQAFLTKRENKDYDPKNLEYATKIATLSPDFSTIWNYKREIMESVLKSKDPPEQYKMLGMELLMLIKAMKQNPKSYTLWFHRMWCLEKGLEIEKFMTDEQMEAAKGGLLKNEIMLCDKMLGADERNFHCWNYRAWVIRTKMDQIEKVYAVREKHGALGESAKTPVEDQISTLACELAMTENMIEKNFSNFSAWHYRGKALKNKQRLEVETAPSPYLIPSDVLQSEFEQMKHAIFTEPNDQSSWNYHRWLVNLLLPVQITELKIEDDQLTIGFSHIVRSPEGLTVKVNDEEVTLLSKKPESRVYTVKLEGELKTLSVTKNESFEEMDGQKLFRNFEGSYSDNQWKHETTEDEILKTLKDTLEREIGNMEELIECESDLELAWNHIFLLRFFEASWTSNSFYENGSTYKEEKIQGAIEKLEKMKPRIKDYYQRKLESLKTHVNFE